MNNRFCLAIVFSVLLVACTNTSSTKPSDGPYGTQTPQASGSPARCHATGSGDYTLPDRGCTPGVADPRVTPASVGTTICGQHSWSRTVRPPVSYTEPLKKQQMKEYGFTDSVSAHEEDHLISLELGGDPRDPHNLWPEPGKTPNPKDKVENKAHTLVCSHPDQLTQIQQAIATDWISYGKQIGAI